jgi:predicted nicotinamide N-methyase
MAEAKAGRSGLSILPTDHLASPAPSGEELRSVIASRYDIDTVRVRAGSEQFDILRVRDSNTLLDRLSPEAFSVDERLPYWADLWTSSIDLAGWVLEERKELAGKHVLELGSGIGLAGIAAARAGAEVVLTDYETDALLFARHNALMNLPAGAFQCRVRCVPMDWRAPDIVGSFDVIIGADIVYERRNFSPVLSLLRKYLAPGGRALLTEPDRAVGQQFLTAARNFPFAVQQSYSTVERDGNMFKVSRMLMRLL